MSIIRFGDKTYDDLDAVCDATGHHYGALNGRWLAGADEYKGVPMEYVDPQMEIKRLRRAVAKMEARQGLASGGHGGHGGKPQADANGYLPPKPVVIGDEVFPSLNKGAKAKGWDGREMWEAIVRDGGTEFMGVPVRLASIDDMESLPEGDVSAPRKAAGQEPDPSTKRIDGKRRKSKKADSEESADYDDEIPF